MLSSKIPFISVRRISFSAFKLSATFPATTSALIFKKLPSLFTPIGAITGIDPEDIIFFNSETRILSTFPTNPKSCLSGPKYFEALIILGFM